MTYVEFYNKIEKLQNEVDKMAKAGNNVNDSYYKAKSLLMGINEGSFRSKSFLKSVSNLFDGTYYLIEILNKYTDYDNNNLVHFNAMALIDAASGKL